MGQAVAHKRPYESTVPAYNNGGERPTYAQSGKRAFSAPAASVRACPPLATYFAQEKHYLRTILHWNILSD